MKIFNKATAQFPGYKDVKLCECQCMVWPIKRESQTIQRLTAKGVILLWMT